MKTRIKEYRARYNMTQEELAKKVGVRRETIVFLEKGKYNPSLKLAYKVAKALNTTIQGLFMFDEMIEFLSRLGGLLILRSPKLTPVGRQLRVFAKCYI